MADHLGSYNTATTRTHVRFQFTTHAASGAPVAPSSAFESADLRIYRANVSAAFSDTQRSSANGITMTSPFDSVTGLHDVDIDLTDNTDAGFYAAGYLYSVVLIPDETVDSLAVTKVLAYFEIGPPPVNVTQVGGTTQTAGDLATMITTVDDLLDTEVAAIFNRIGAPAGASIAADIALITTATNAGDLASKTADAGTITTGTNTSGSFSDTASDDNTYWITAPVTPAVGGFGLRFNLRFDLVLGRVPTQLEIKGYWSGSGQTADVYALNNRTGVYDKLTNTGTNLLSRTSEFTYAITIPRDYADDSGGANNIVTIEVRSTSTNTAHRMRIDRALIYHVDEAAVFTMTGPTAEEIWTYVTRSLTTPGEEPVDLTAIETAVTAIQAKTDSLTFTVAAQVDANIQYVNNVQVDGVGSPADPWGP